MLTSLFVTRWRASVAGLALVALACGCGSDAGGARGPMGDEPGPTPPPPFAPLPPHVYATKIKQLITGLPLTDEELARVVAEQRAALPALIDGWMSLPQWREKMLVFFRQAFQQTQTDIADYDEQIGRPTNPWNRVDKLQFVRSAEESFARTALALIEEGRAFTETVTTERFLLNPPLMSAYAYMDAVPLNDLGRPVPAELWLLGKYPMLAFERTTNPDPVTLVPRPIPISESIDPASPNFMRWYEPHPYQGVNERCREPQIVRGIQALRFVADYVHGGRPGCGTTDSQWTDQDWQSWRWVTIRSTRAGEERTTFWDLARLRDPGTQELVLATPRVGFMTTPAFFANWPTNLSNSYRVTANQALIVGLGRSFDDRGVTVTVNETSSDDEHVEPGTPCFGCHVTLDPMRDFFRRSYSLSYFQQLNLAGLPPRAHSPSTAARRSWGRASTRSRGRWPSIPLCGGLDAEALPVRQRFPLSERRSRVSAGRRPLRGQRPRLEDAGAGAVRLAPGHVCRDYPHLREPGRGGGHPAPRGAVRGARAPAGDPRPVQPGLAPAGRRGRTGPEPGSQPCPQPGPGDSGGGYARGDEQPLMPRDPNLFFQAATENLCLLLSTQLVDMPLGPQLFVSARPAEAVSNLVGLLIGLPASDPRAPALSALLREHNDEARASGVTAREALQSTFLLACAAPPAISMGL